MKPLTPGQEIQRFRWFIRHYYRVSDAGKDWMSSWLSEQEEKRRPKRAGKVK